MNQHAPATTDYMDRYLVDGPLWLGISRGIASFFGAVCLLDAFRALITNQRGADFGWVDLSPCPPDAARGLLAFAGVALLLFGMTHRLPKLIRPVAIIGAMSLVAIAVANAIAIHRSIQQGTLQDGIPMPAHLVTLLVPVIFGIVRGRQYGPLRFPLGGSVLIFSFVAAGAAFSLGYVSSLSKFHLPQAADTVVVMHPREAVGELSLAPQVTVTQELIKSGYSGRVVVVGEPNSVVPGFVVGEIQRVLPVGTEVTSVSVDGDVGLVQALVDRPRSTLMFVGDQRESARVRLLAQQLGDRVCFVNATAQSIDGSVVDDIKQLWSTWVAPLHSRLRSQVLAEAQNATR